MRGPRKRLLDWLGIELDPWPERAKRTLISGATLLVSGAIVVGTMLSAKGLGLPMALPPAAIALFAIDSELTGIVIDRGVIRPPKPFREAADE